MGRSAGGGPVASAADRVRRLSHDGSVASVTTEVRRLSYDGSVASVTTGPSPQSPSRRRGRGGREARAALRPHQPPPLPLRVRPSPQGTHRLSGPAGRGGRAIRIDAPPQSQRRGPGVAGRSGGRRQGAESAERGVVASLLLIRQLLICQSNRRVGRGAQSHSRFAPRAERSASATRPTSPNRGVHGPCRTRTAAGLRRELGLDSYHSLARRPPPAGDRMDSDGPVAAE